MNVLFATSSSVSTSTRDQSPYRLYDLYVGPFRTIFVGKSFRSSIHSMYIIPFSHQSA